MIMKVAVPLPKHSPMFGQRRFFAHRVQLVLAQDLLDLVEALLGEPALTRIQSGFFSARRGHHLDRDARGLGLRLLLGAGVVVGDDGAVLGVVMG